MSFIRVKRRPDKSGKMLSYHYLVANVWENGKSRQKVIEYLGTSPYGPPREFEIQPLHAGALATGLMQKTLLPDDVFRTLDAQGTQYTRTELERVGLIFEFPGKKLYVCLYPARRRAGRRGAPSAARRSRSTRRGTDRSSSSAGSPGSR